MFQRFKRRVWMSCLALLVVGLGYGAYSLVQAAIAARYQEAAEARIQRDDFPEALALLKAAHERSPGNRELLLLLARTARQADRIPEGLHWLRAFKEAGGAAEDLLLEQRRFR